ncbi:hypothetical protein E3N88_43000 [Mikania micrantha]|uniref:Dol-P-Glc:Glc(2)Man(9)GlcNAc(2)-PP-Dol alpha-1,2-glucosyltransferase n=1 Tax=Mikania micrantha TaxID=192012 RepID=A0A5N6LG48_9ASTR|nr:hypothetical protein E3N88_43000 [Mikania micrantha]
MRDDHNRIYKSFSDVIKGKEGIVHKTLLGKGADYSRRSLIFARVEARLLKFSHESFVSNLGFKKQARGAIKRKAQLSALHCALCNTRRDMYQKRGLFAIFVEAYQRRNTTDPILLKEVDESNEWLMDLMANDEIEDALEVVFDDDNGLTWRDVEKASGAFEPIYYARANAPQKFKGKDDEDDEEMEEQFGVSEDDVEDVVLGIDVDDDDEDSLFSEIQGILLVLWHLKWELLVSFSPFVALLLAFAAFVVWNGSIVLGAKEAHTVSPHFAQLLYFSLLSCFMAPVHFSKSHVASLAQSFLKSRPLNILLWLSVTIICFLMVHYFSIAHPYLLADNRHYPFYLWRKIINAHWSTRYLLVPLYVYSWASILNILAKVQEKVWVLAYFVASAAVLVPAPLIEFRYYTIPFFFLIIHCPFIGTMNLEFKGLYGRKRVVLQEMTK